MYGLGKPLEELILKVERAKKHVLDLEAAYGGFMKSQPYAYAFKAEADTGDRLYYVTKIVPVPLTLSLLIGDAVSNLRTALDHAAYQLVLVGGGKRDVLKDAKFPIGNSPLDYKSQRDRIVSGLRPDAIKALDGLQPYKGGTGEYFVHLARLNNFDKHRLLVPVWSCVTARTTLAKDREWLAASQGRNPEDFRFDFTVFKNWVFPSKVGDIIMTVPKEEVQDDMHFMFQIAFGEPEIVKGNPVIETLNEMTNMVRHLIFEFDRFGLFR